MKTAHNRTILIIAFFILVGFLAVSITDKTTVLAIIGAAAAPLITYLGLKGMGTNSNKSVSE